jgi:hypothetical protein
LVLVVRLVVVFVVVFVILGLGLARVQLIELVEIVDAGQVFGDGCIPHDCPLVILAQEPGR